MNKFVKKMFLTFVIAVSILLLFYMIISIYIGLSAKKLIVDVYNSNNITTSHVTDESIIEKFDVRRKHDINLNLTQNNEEVKEEFIISPLPICVFNFTEGKIYYEYTYIFYKDGERVCGSTQVPVELTFKFEKFNWIITDYQEEP